MNDVPASDLAHSRHTPDVLVVLRKVRGHARSALAKSTEYGAGPRNRRKVEALDMAIAEIERLYALIPPTAGVFVVGQDEYDGMSPALVCLTELKAQQESIRLQRATGRSHSHIHLEVSL